MTQSDIFFFGVTFDAEQRSTTLGFTGETDMCSHKIVIKQIMLGPEANYDEYNVVEVDSPDDSVNIPIAVLNAEEQRSINPGLEFYASRVTFTLTSGSGPVYMYGNIFSEDVEVESLNDGSSSS